MWHMLVLAVNDFIWEKQRCLQYSCADTQLAWPGRGLGICNDIQSVRCCCLEIWAWPGYMVHSAGYVAAVWYIPVQQLFNRDLDLV